MKTPKIVIADLDGTIALIEHRHWLDAERHLEITSDERWRTFFAQRHGDMPNWPVIWTLRALQMTGYYIHIFSGRSDEVREEAIDWFEAFNVPYNHLRMCAASTAGEGLGELGIDNQTIATTMTTETINGCWTILRHIIG